MQSQAVPKERLPMPLKSYQEGDDLVNSVFESSATPISRSSSKMLKSRPVSSNLPEVVPTHEKEVFFADEKQVAGAGEKEVLEEQNYPEAIDEGGGKEVVHSSGYSPSRQLTFLNGYPRHRRVSWILAAILLVVLLAIGLGVGLGLGLQKGSSSHEPSSGSLQGSAQIIGGSLNAAYYSTEGAFNGTGIAIAAQSFPGSIAEEGVLVLYFQHHTGQIRYMQSNSTGHWIGGEPSNIVAIDAKNNTPIYAVSYLAADYSSEWHVFCITYIDNQNMIRERYNSNQSTFGPPGVWQDGTINNLNVTVMDSEQAGMLGCWYGDTYGDPDFNGGVNNTDDVGIRLWYASNATTFQQLGWRRGNNAWAYEESWPNLSGYTSPACYSWGPTGTTTYTAFVDLRGTSSIYWQDTVWNKISTAEHPINQWTNSSVAITDLDGAADLAYTDFLYGQSQSDHMIRGYNISWGAENTTRVPDGDVVVGDEPGVPGTRLEVTELPRENGANDLVVYFQTNGSDITEFRRDLEGDTWTKTALPIPHN